jgi:AraC-like DNA-binding protein/tetratricopeptide (TPR) repeat protein
MRHDSVKADYDLQLDVIEILLDAYRLERDYEQALYWATRLSDVYREHGMRHLLSYSNAEIGALMVRIGQQQEGLARIDSAVQQLAGHRHYTEMNLALLALKRKADVSAETGRYQETTDAAQQMLGMLDDFEQHPADYYDQGNTYSGITVEERPRYIDFYRSRAYSFLALAAASQQQPQQAIHYLDLYGQTDASQTLHGRYVTTPILLRLGRYDRMLAIYDEVEQSMADDTLNANFADILRGRAEVAESQGRTVAANGYWRRYADLSQQLSDSLLRGKAHLFAARYHAQEQQREIERQRADAAHTRQVALVLGIVAGLLLMLVGILLSYQRIIRRKNRVLAREIAESIEYKEKYRKTLSQKTFPQPLPEGREVGTPANEAAEALSGKSIYTPTSSEEQGEGILGDGSDAQLFRFLREAILRDELFLNPLFDRQQLMDTYHLSKDRIGAAFKQGSEFESLIDFLNDCRLDYSAKLLSTRPDMTIGEVSAASGFASVNTFGRNFKRKFTITPSQYREQRQEMG